MVRQNWSGGCHDEFDITLVKMLRSGYHPKGKE